MNDFWFASVKSKTVQLFAYLTTKAGVKRGGLLN